MPSAPVIFLVFNRPQLTARVFARIRDARPAHLHVVADGPREGHSEDKERCRQVRALIEGGIDWPCRLVRDYSEKNLGCARRVSSGITNAFEDLEEAIILEDDCLPDPSFFPFCSELLEYYREDDRISMISGTNQQYGHVVDDRSYFFGMYGHIWGWATWRRAWKWYDFEMAGWPQMRASARFKELFPDSNVRRFWRRAWDDTMAEKLDTWDHRWTFNCVSRQKLAVLPSVSMVENLGFGEDSTHTVQVPEYVDTPGVMTFPLVHPVCPERNQDAEMRTARREYYRRHLLFRILKRIRSIRNRIFLSLGPPRS